MAPPNTQASTSKPMPKSVTCTYPSGCRSSADQG
jgi:hypothetical protein